MAVSTQVAPNEGLERVAAVLCHGSLLLGVPFVLPLAVWLLYPVFKGSSPYVKQQALQSLLFHLLVVVVTGVFVVAALAMGLGAVLMTVIHAAMEGGVPPSGSYSSILVFMLLLVVWTLFFAWASIIELVATVKALQGKPYQLPIVKNWL